MTSPYLLPALADRLEEMAARKDLEPVEVAVLDSGVDATHPDLAGRVVEAFKIEMEDDIPRVKEIPQGTNNDQFGHGTGVASIIARLAPNARLVDIRVLGADNRGAGAGLVAGLRVAVRRKSKIINMSLAASAGFSQKIMTLCEEAYHANTLIVAAKLNMPLKDYGFPAEFSSSISVDNDTFPSPFVFNYMPDNIIEYAAHGNAVPVAAVGGGYTTMTGTSFATPTVTGLCTLIRGAYPGLRPFEIKTILKAFAKGSE